jgi:hypothetical protein
MDIESCICIVLFLQSTRRRLEGSELAVTPVLLSVHIIVPS